MIGLEDAPYAELHLHTCYSLLEGASTPKELIGRAAQYGYDSLAITDRNNLYGAMVFARACRDAGIRSIIGVELTVAADPDVDPDADPDVPPRPHAAGRDPPGIRQPVPAGQPGQRLGPGRAGRPGTAPARSLRRPPSRAGAHRRGRLPHRRAARGTGPAGGGR